MSASMRALESTGAPEEPAPASARVALEPATGLVLSDGSQAQVVNGALELRDESGRILIRYDRGAAEIAVPTGDLTLSAPAGRVLIKSGMDVAIEAARDVSHHAGRSLDLSAGRAGATPQVKIGPRTTEMTADEIRVKAKKSHVATEHATILARTIVTSAVHIATAAERYEMTATRLFERTKDAFRTIAGLAETRIGRARTLVEDQYALHTGRTVMTSKEETSVDGSKILLG